MTNYFKYFALILLSLSMLACGSTKPSSFYMLTSISETKPEQTLSSAQSNLYLGIGPVKFPEYLNRSQIVKRTSGSEVNIAETHRWAEPLDYNFTRVLADNLSVLLKTEKLSLHPWRNWNVIDYQVSMGVTRFDANEQGKITLIAHWKLHGKEGKEQIYAQKSVIYAQANSTSYSDIALAHSQAVEQLSRKIADEIDKFEQ